MHAGEITIVDMMKMLAPSTSIRELIYSAMDEMTRCRYTDDEVRKHECMLNAWNDLHMAIEITYDKH